MSYFLHITRAQYQFDSLTHPIDEQEWNDFVSRDSELVRVEATEKVGLNPKTGLTITFRQPAAIVWNNPATCEDEAFFSYRNGKISVRNPSDAAIAKMKAIANALNAKVKGDEDEIY